jgi:hypothetical protein
MAAGLAMIGAITSYNLLALIISSSLIPLGMGIGIASINTLVSLRASADRQGLLLQRSLLDSLNVFISKAYDINTWRQS